MDTKPTSLHSAEEMEEAEQIPADDDPCGIQTRRCPQDLGQNEQMAVREPERGPLCDEPLLVQDARTGISQ